MDPVLRRRRLIIHRRLEGWKIRDIADALRISEKTVDRWLSVYRKERWEGLRVKSRRRRHYYKTPQSIVDLILELRGSRHWGPNKIKGYLRNYRFHGITPVSHRTIHQILVEAGLSNPIPEPRRVWGKRRFEREHSNPQAPRRDREESHRSQTARRLVQRKHSRAPETTEDPSEQNQVITKPYKPGRQRTYVRFALTPQGQESGAFLWRGNTWTVCSKSALDCISPDLFFVRFNTQSRLFGHL